MSEIEIPEPDAMEGVRHPRLTPLLFGQEAAEQTFLAAFNSTRMHHGWLISGPRGVGKATLAWRIARFLLGRADEEGTAPPASLDMPGDSAISHRIDALAEPRLILCRRGWDDRKKRLKTVLTVDEVRKLIGFFHLSSTDGGHRVAIVDSVDEMNTSAANALLKVLEEPPARSTLLLISHNPMGLLPTIRSRCRTLTCAPLSPRDLEQALAAAGIESPVDPALIEMLAQGSVGDAIRLLSDGGIEIYQTLVQLLSPLSRMDRAQAIKLAESCTGAAGAVRYDLCLRLIGRLLHRLATAGLQGNAPADGVRIDAEILGRFAQTATTSRRWAVLAAELTARAEHARAVHLDPASVILDMLIKIDRTAAELAAA